MKVKHTHPTYESPAVRQECLLDAQRVSLAALRSARVKGQAHKEKTA